MLALYMTKRRKRMMSDKPMSLRELRRWVSHLQPKGDRDAKAKWMLLDLVREAQMKERAKKNGTE